MATKTLVLNKAIVAEVAKIEKQLAKSKPLQAGAPASDKLCAFYTKARPVLVLLASLSPKVVGPAIAAIGTGIDVYCSIDSGGIISPADAKKLSKAIASICAGYAKVSAIIDMAIMLFGKGEIGKVLNALSAAIKKLCETPAA